MRRYWGYDSFRPLQAEIIDAVLGGADTLALMPTGGGKSITFQVPGLMLPGLTVVVTPLISLMKDQVENLRARDIAAVYIHSGLTLCEARLAMQKAELGKVKFLYVSPERLQNERFVGELKTWNVSLLVVDEAHCISQWGYDFRPSYLEISRLRVYFKNAPVLAVTASATPQVAADICTRLDFRLGWRRFAMSFARPNIYYIVRHDINKAERLMTVMRNTGGTAIVYVRSRAKTGDIARMLSAAGIPAAAYHAGLAPEVKDERQSLWKSGRVRVMVATNAFGMGIDKPDVRVVVHYDLPSSIEEYYQEAGRAGRDGKPSFAVALVSPRDRGVLARRLEDAFPPREYIADVYTRACLFIDLAMGEGYNKVFDFDFERFCTEAKLWPAAARSALRLLEAAGYLEFVEEPDARARVMMTCRREELYEMTLTPIQEELVVYLLRSCPGIFADYVNISETVIASHLSLTADSVYHTLLELTRMHALHYVPRRVQPYLYFPSRRIEGRHVEIPREVYDDRRSRMQERIEAIERFAFADDACRASTILRYFGQEPEADCGTCDVCRDRGRQDVAARAAAAPDAVEALRHLCATRGRIGLREAVRALNLRDEVVADALRRLVDRGELTINPDNTVSPCKHL